MLDQGTGKSLLLRAIISRLRRKHDKRPDFVAVTASTGMAASNIGGESFPCEFDTRKYLCLYRNDHTLMGCSDPR